jgi:hypothetical protein
MERSGATDRDLSASSGDRKEEEKLYSNRQQRVGVKGAMQKREREMDATFREGGRWRRAHALSSSISPFSSFPLLTCPSIASVVALVVAFVALASLVAIRGEKQLSS